jgi:P4 family phage/plasmid primase-like protien
MQSLKMSDEEQSKKEALDKHNQAVEALKKEFKDKLDNLLINKELIENFDTRPLDEQWEEFVSKNKLKKKKVGKIVKVDEYLHNARIFKDEVQPYFYDKNGLFWFWQSDEYKWEIVDEVDLMNSIDESLNFYGATINPKIKANYIEAFKRIGRLHTPKAPPKEWVQFKSKVFDIKTGKIMDATAEYFFCNPIPWKIGDSTDTPTIDKLFREWVGEEYVATLYEIISYCCYPDYPIHLLFSLTGTGRNGKSQFQRLIVLFVGVDNTCSTELDVLLDSRFESVKLYKKLVCSMGETNFGVINKTSLLKKLTGQDLIGYEFKNKKPFDDYNYAKILINSNSLPSSEDTSEGFYRRWLIIDFPNQFPEGKSITDSIPLVEFENLARKVTEILPKLIDKASFSNQGTIEQRREKYIKASNPLMFFIDQACDKADDLYVRYSELYTAYVYYLSKHKKRIISRREFSSALTKEGFEVRKTSEKVNEVYISDRFVYGLKIKPNFMTDMTHMTQVVLSSPTHESRVEPQSYQSHLSQDPPPRVRMIEEISDELPIYLKVEDVKSTLYAMFEKKQLVEIQEFLSLYPPQFHTSIELMIRGEIEINMLYEPRSGFIAILQ